MIRSGSLTARIRATTSLRRSTSFPWGAMAGCGYQIAPLRGNPQARTCDRGWERG